jgi:hypothetical protein
MYLFLDTATGCFRCFSPVGTVTGVALPTHGIGHADENGSHHANSSHDANSNKDFAPQRHDFGHIVHSAVDAGARVIKSAILTVEATTIDGRADGGAPTYTGRLADSSAFHTRLADDSALHTSVHTRGRQLRDILQRAREGKADGSSGTGGVHSIKAFADAARMATAAAARRPRADTLSERWDRWVSDWMVWSEAHKVTFNLTPGINAASRAKPELGRRHTAGPNAFQMV